MSMHFLNRADDVDDDDNNDDGNWPGNSILHIF